MTATNTTPTTTLLTLLHQYTTLHATASANFKSTLWNITKARRGRGYQSSGGGPLGSSEYSVESVREELEATAVVEVKGEKDEPELVDEHDDASNNSKLILDAISSSLDVNTMMVLHFDGVEGIKRDAANNAVTNTSETAIGEYNNSNQEGLRRRKNKGSNNNDDSKSTWTEEQSQAESQKAPSDPLQLFGVPPPALRVAQSYSRESLAYYVEVANLARQIMTIVQEQEE